MGWLSDNLYDAQEELKIKISYQESQSDFKEGPIFDYKQNKKTIKFSHEYLKLFFKPIVYIFWRYENKENKIALYIGKSMNGLARPIGLDHHQHSKIKDADEFELFPCDDVFMSAKLEKNLIKHLHPVYNSKRSKKTAKLVAIKI